MRSHEHMEHDLKLLNASWQRCWHELAMQGDSRPLFEELLVRHAEPHRRYHTLQHLSECLAWCEMARPLAVQPAEIELALWFHDAIYQLQAVDNEQQSADWACAALTAAALTAAAVPAAAVDRVAQMVLATRHAAPPATADEQLVVDIDLAILGAAEPRFAEYETQIRDEYAFVPAAIYREKRREILQSFLARDKIYRSHFFFARLESSARSNLAGVLAKSY